MSTPKLSPYLKRLDTLRKLNLLPDQRGNKFTPKIVFLDTRQGVSEVGDAIAQGWPVVTDYGATYGTAFPPGIRQAIAAARKESEPLQVVSLVTFRDIAYQWMDTGRIHPDVMSALNHGKFDILTGIAFLRFAGNSHCQDTLGPHYVNSRKEVQVFIVPDSDPLMSYLRSDHNLAYIAVRSSNISGHPEEPFAAGAAKYAQAIGAPILAVRSLESFNAQVEDERLARENLFDRLRRKRFGSQPIIHLPSVDDEPVITVVRAGNTEPSTLQRLMSRIVSHRIGFVYRPEKVTTFARPRYHVADDVIKPAKIRRLLLEHSGLK